MTREATIARAGNVYCAGRAHVWIWSPSGKLLDKIETPTRPINWAFGDSDMNQLPWFNDMVEDMDQFFREQL